MQIFSHTQSVPKWHQEMIYQYVKYCSETDDHICLTHRDRTIQTLIVLFVKNEILQLLLLREISSENPQGLNDVLKILSSHWMLMHKQGIKTGRWLNFCLNGSIFLKFNVWSESKPNTSSWKLGNIVLYFCHLLAKGSKQVWHSSYLNQIFMVSVSLTSLNLTCY